MSLNSDFADAKFCWEKGIIRMDYRVGFLGSSLHGFGLHDRRPRLRAFVAESLTLTLGLLEPIETRKVNIVVGIQNLQRVQLYNIALVHKFGNG